MRLRDGRILASGSPKYLCRPLQGRILELVAGPRRLVKAVARRDPQVEAIQMTGAFYRIRVTSGALQAVTQRLPSSLEAAGCTLTSLTPVEPTLEDAFSYLIQPVLEGSVNE